MPTHLWKEGNLLKHTNVSGGGEFPYIKTEVRSLKDVEMDTRQANIASIIVSFIPLLRAVPHISIQRAPSHPLGHKRLKWWFFEETIPGHPELDWELLIYVLLADPWACVII